VTFTVAHAVTASVDFVPYLCKDSTIILSSTINGSNLPYTNFQWTQSGTGLLQITNNNDTAIVKGIVLGKVYVNFTVMDATGCTAQVRDSIEVVDCSQFSLTNDSPTGDNFMINDPCTCKGNGLFADVVWIEPTQAGQIWTVKSIAPFLPGGSSPQGITAGDPLIYNATAGIHEIIFDHVDSSGFAIVVEGPNLPGTPGNTSLAINNICY
jgi:hypothetical protein